jgi:hypothetical protein
MGDFTRTSDTEAAYQSDRGVRYRLIAAAPGFTATWMIIADVIPPQPTYYAIPGQPGVYGLEIRRGNSDSLYGGDGEIVGWAENLADAARPVEIDLLMRGVELGI